MSKYYEFIKKNFDNMNNINICLCTKDDYYIKYTASLLESLHINKNPSYEYIIYILWWELSK